MLDYMTDFQRFIEVNGLLKKELAEYLGVSGAFISQICNGKRTLPVAKLALIKANTKNWDISMLNQESSPISNSGVYINGNNRINHSPIDNRQYYSDSPDVLRAQIEILDERIKEKDAQIKEKDAQIKQLLEILAKR